VQNAQCDPCSKPSKDGRNPSRAIPPCQPLLVVKPPAGPGWLHEVKHDGYRIVARKQGERVTLWTRYGADFTDRLPRIAEAVPRPARREAP
jgi:ATP-dependent DNA ligase